MRAAILEVDAATGVTGVSASGLRNPVGARLGAGHGCVVGRRRLARGARQGPGARLSDLDASGCLLFTDDTCQVSNIDAMPHIAPRLLLAFCLVLNGIRNAVAAVGMPASMAGTHHATMTEADPQTAEACLHGEGDTVAMEQPIKQAAPSAAHPADCGEHCCDQGTCNCLCMQLAQAALLSVPVVSLLPGQIRMSAVFPLGHATPSLLHPIRPPIG